MDLHIWKEKKIWTMLCMLGAAPVSAQDLTILECRFQTECFEIEACAESGYEMTLTLTPSGARTMAVATTVSESMSGGGFDLPGGARSFLFQSQMGPVMLTLSPDGAARQAVHGAADAMMINYTGQCEVVG